MSNSAPAFAFDNSYARDMGGFYVAWEGAKVPAPAVVLANDDLASDLGLAPEALRGPEAAAIFSGTKPPEGASPIAQIYAGHQFGGFSPQLGDGRALLLGEVIDRAGRRRDIQLKGSGPTPFSRGGDGKAVIGPVLREYILGEAMHALGIPTTRALAATTTGESIYRDGPKPGAVLTRVAASHIRVGTFQYFAARGQTDMVRRLADYAIDRHDPDLSGHDDRYLELFRQVIRRQAELVAKWMLVGFVHGVMNTDNTTISGETIDYGPCAFIDAYDPAAVFSSIDHGGRYAFGRQPTLIQWNLARLAESLLSLFHRDDIDQAVQMAGDELDRFADLYRDAWLDGMRTKLGLTTSTPGDQAMAEDLLSLMKDSSADYTKTFRSLGKVAEGAAEPFLSAFNDRATAEAWVDAWRLRLNDGAGDTAGTGARMMAVNPVYIPRNHMVEDALQQAESGSYDAVKRLLEVVKAPYAERQELQAFAEPPAADARPYVTFCGT